jgi:hypothetical protein
MRRRVNIFTSMITLVAIMLTSVSPVAYAQDPVVPGSESVTISGGGGDSFIDVVLRPLIDIVQNPFSENTIAIGLLLLSASRFKKLVEAFKEVPQAYRNKQKLIAEIQDAERGYESARAEYLSYESHIEKLRVQHSELTARIHDPLVGKAINERARMQEELKAIEREIKEKVAKLPLLQVVEGVHALQKLEANRVKLMADFDGLMKVHYDEARSSSNKRKKNSAIEARVAAALSRRFGQVSYLNEWLETGSGRTFLETEEGRGWYIKYRNLQTAAEKKVREVVAAYNLEVDRYNLEVLPSERQPRLAPFGVDSSYRTDRFLLTPESAEVRSEEIHRDQLPVSAKSNCERNFGLLGRSIEKLKSQVRFRDVYANQIYQTKFTLAVGLVLFGYYRNFQSRHQQTFFEARANTRRSDKITENKRLDISGQLDDEHKGANRLRTFFQYGVTALLENEGAIADSIRSRLSFRSQNDGKLKALNDRMEQAGKDEDAEIARATVSLDAAMKKVLRNSAWTTVDDVVKNIYTLESAKRDTEVKRNLTLIYREAIANLFPDVMDEGTLDQIEMSIIPKMVNETNSKLQALVEARAKARQAASGAGGKEPEARADTSKMPADPVSDASSEKPPGMEKTAAQTEQSLSAIASPLISPTVVLSP